MLVYHDGLIRYLGNNKRLALVDRKSLEFLGYSPGACYSLLYRFVDLDSGRGGGAPFSA